MQNNTPMTPQLADVGFSITGAILAVLEDPKAAAAAVRQYADAMKLNDAEMAKVEEARKTIAQAEDIRKKADGRMAEAEKIIENYTARKSDLDKNWALYSDAAQVLSSQQKAHGINAAQLEKNIAQFQKDRKRLDQELVQLDTDRRSLDRREAELAKREKAIAEFTKSMGGKAA